MARGGPLLLAAVVALVLAGCGSQGLDLPEVLGGGDRGEPSLEQASERTAGPTDGHPPIGTTVEPSTYIDHLAAGWGDTTSARMVMEQEVDGVLFTTVTVIDLAPDVPRLQNTTSTVHGQLVVRVVGDRAWARGTDLATAPTWVRLDPQDPDDPFGPTAGMLIETLARGEIDPGTTTGLEAVTYLGADTVEGVGPELDHYRVVVDVTQAPVPPGSPALTDQELADAGMDRLMKADVWLEPSGLTRRTEFSVDGVVTVQTFDRFGSDFGLDVPDADAVISMDQARRQSESAG